LKDTLGVEASEQIVIRARDGTWGIAGIHDGKQRFLESAAAELTTTRGAHITGSSTLLIDDDFKNIEMAKAAGINAVWFDPERADR
jgi:hypothetical protein